MRIVGKLKGKVIVELIFENNKLKKYKSSNIPKRDFDFFFKKPHINDGQWSLDAKSPENAAYVLEAYFHLEADGDIPEAPYREGVRY